MTYKQNQRWGIWIMIAIVLIGYCAVWATTAYLFDPDYQYEIEHRENR